MAIVAARRSAHPDFVYLEGEDYVARASRRQTSSIFAKTAPFVTGSYLDEIALAAAIAAPAPLVVLGGSFGSTFPLCARAAPEVRIVSVDRDEEAARAGRHFLARAGAGGAVEWRTERAEEVAPAILAEAGAVFIDLYEPDALSRVALDAKLHRAIRSVALLNIFDVHFGEPTRRRTL